MSIDLRKADLTTVSSYNHDPDSLLTTAFRNETWPSNDLFNQKLKVVERPILFQICMIENISRSKLSQIEEYQVLSDPKKQKVDRLRTSRERQELISEVRMDDEDDEGVMVNAEQINSTAPKGGGSGPAGDVGNVDQHVYKLILQDRLGNMFFAINLDSIPGLKTCMLGSKIILLPGSRFSRGMFTFTNKTVKLMYGLISTWNEQRLQKLTAYLENELALHKSMVNDVGKRQRS